MNKERVLVKEAVDGQFFFEHQAGNGEILETSETYLTRDHAVRGAETAHPDLPVVSE